MNVIELRPRKVSFEDRQQLRRVLRSLRDLDKAIHTVSLIDDSTGLRHLTSRCLRQARIHLASDRDSLERST